MRVYNWVQMQPNMKGRYNNQPNFEMEHGMMSMIQGRTNAGHLGQSIMMTKKLIWVGEPMSEQGTFLLIFSCAHFLIYLEENGRVYRWFLNNNNVQCIRNNRAILVSTLIICTEP